MIYIIFVVLSVFAFLFIKIKNIFNMRVIKLDIILSVLFSVIITIIYSIFYVIEIYILGIKAKKIIDSIDSDGYKIFNLETIFIVLKTGIYLFVISSIILLFIFLIIEFGIKIYKFLKRGKTST